MNIALFTITTLVATTGATPFGARIIGGSPAKDGQFPHMVSLRYVDPIRGDMHMCGGTIINERWIVTAAHCVVGYHPEDYYIKAGTTSLTQKGIIYQIEGIIYHKDYEGLNITDDIALITVNTNIEFIKNKVSPLPLNTDHLQGGEDVTFAGWGSTELWGQPPDQLQWLEAKVVPEDVCQEAQKPFPVTEGMICTGAGIGHGACHGDSGSFLMGNGKLVGVVSWGRPCAKGFPDVFTRVSHYVGWVDEQIANWKK